ncbi:hypothetical protein [Bradyrhizobium sp. 200]|uniref:hypothetical protein n=1 Tax=Bradyrhizobium sp. 200 TaxID=2782665 RepID=UPI001FFEB20D|nr:hypothetical protein [Bradyrhizobium sp. 200]
METDGGHMSPAGGEKAFYNRETLPGGPQAGLSEQIACPRALRDRHIPLVKPASPHETTFVLFANKSHLQNV